MPKRKKRTISSAPRTQRQMLDREQMSITDEANYIISRAQDNDARVVTIGPLILFSTETGDGWMLDPEDGLALCLARVGEAQPFTITETSANFSIEWKASYQIDGDVFIVTEGAGRTRSILGYPTAEILRATRRVRRD
jgi:hypothetical protein